MYAETSAYIVRALKINLKISTASYTLFINLTYHKSAYVSMKFIMKQKKQIIYIVKKTENSKKI